MKKPSLPMSRTDALATIAFCLLSTRGQTDNPTWHDIVLAVVQASPLLDITVDAHAAHIQLTVADKLVRRHKWNIGKVMLLRPRPKGYPRPRKTTTARPGEGASR